MSDNFLTPQFVFGYERRMRVIQNDEYANALLADNIWWPEVTMTRPIEGAAERIAWFLATAMIRPNGDGGNIDYEPMVTQSTEVTVQRHNSATKVKKDALLDAAGGGLDALAEWARQSGQAASYYPQRLTSELIMNGANTDGSAMAYDGVPYFADNNTVTTFGGIPVIGHPYNPYNPYAGGYVNWFHGSATTFTQPNGAVVSYPGACPIDPVNATTVDAAFNNLARAIQAVGQWKMPDGVTPRFQRVKGLLIPTNLVTRATELTNAKVIAQAAGSSGGGGGDVEAVIRRWGLGQPFEAQELNAATSYQTQLVMSTPAATTTAPGTRQTYTETITGSDTSYYLIMEKTRTAPLGALIHVLREAFKTNYFFGEQGYGSATGIDAILNRALEIEYIMQGRMAQQYGHPYGLVRVDAT